jgi:membrane protein required for beta-lactamase induction
MYDPSDILMTILFWFLVAGIPLGLARWAFGRWFAKHGDQGRLDERGNVSVLHVEDGGAERHPRSRLHLSTRLKTPGS